MTREDFEQLYEKTREKAVDVAARACGDREVAEDAVQEAALYCLQRIDAQPGSNVTEAFFIRTAVDRARNGVKPRGVDRNTKRREARGQDGRSREVALGSALDLDRALYGPDDE